MKNKTLPYPDLQKLPFIGRYIARFDGQVGKIGLLAACRRLVEHTRTRRIISITPRTKHHLSKSPCLVVCNHPHDLETVSLFSSLPNRRDTFVVAAHSQAGYGPHLAKHIIPVCVWGKHEQGNVKLSVRIARLFNLHPVISYQEAHQRNITAINYAADLVNQGHQVIFFPEGPCGKEGRWLSGIGYLTRQISHPRAKLVFAYVTGTSNLDPFRLIPGLSYILPSIHVTFSSPISINTLPSRPHPRDLTKLLEKKYHSLFSPLRRHHGLSLSLSALRTIVTLTLFCL